MRAWQLFVPALDQQVNIQSRHYSQTKFRKPKMHDELLFFFFPVCVSHLLSGNGVFFGKFTLICIFVDFACRSPCSLHLVSLPLHVYQYQGLYVK